MTAVFTDRIGQPLAIGDRVFKIDGPTGAILWSNGGTVVGFGRTLVHVKWSGHHYTDRKRHHAVKESAIRRKV